MRKMILLAVPLLALIAGCASPYMRAYEGPERPLSEVARIVGFVDTTETQLLPTSQVYVKAVDGEEMRNLAGGMPKEVQVLPGVRTVTVLWQGNVPAHVVSGEGQFAESTKPKTLKLNARAGQSYVVMPYVFKLETRNAAKVVFWIEDRSTGKVVGGKKPSFLE